MFSDHFYPYLVWSLFSPSDPSLFHCPCKEWCIEWIPLTIIWTNTENISPFERSPVCWGPLQVAGSSKVMRRRTSQEVTISFFCLFLLSPNDCGHHLIFWFFFSQLQNSSDFVTNRFMVNLPKKTFLFIKLSFGFWNQPSCQASREQIKILVSILFSAGLNIFRA